MNKLHVENFITLKNVDIELRDFTLLIGPQAAGKSLLAKCAYLFRSLPGALVKSQGRRELEERMLRDFKRFFPEHAWAKQGFEITYTTALGFIRFAKAASGKGQLELCVSEHYDGILEGLDAWHLRAKAMAGRSRRTKQGVMREVITKAEIADSFKNYLETIKFGFGKDSQRERLFNFPIYVPAGRSFFSTFASSLYGLLDDNVSIDPFIIKFGKAYSSSKSTYDGLVAEGDVDFLPFKSALEQVIGGVFTQDIQQNKEWITSADGRKTEVAYTSSGQQEAMPMLLVLLACPFTGDPYFFVVEELEAHLFPEAQRVVVESIAAIYNQAEQRNSYLLTTHSPYVLSVFNLLLKASRVETLLSAKPAASTAKLKKLHRLFPKNKQVPPDALAAYAVDQGGCRSIVDRESGLLSDDYIDSVSDYTGDAFEKLLDLEYGDA